MFYLTCQYHTVKVRGGGGAEVTFLSFCGFFCNYAVSMSHPVTSNGTTVAECWIGKVVK
jgi:hypothetical protein